MKQRLPFPGSRRVPSEVTHRPVGRGARKRPDLGVVAALCEFLTAARTLRLGNVHAGSKPKPGSTGGPAGDPRRSRRKASPLDPPDDVYGPRVALANVGRRKKLSPLDPPDDVYGPRVALANVGRRKKLSPLDPPDYLFEDHEQADAVSGAVQVPAVVSKPVATPDGDRKNTSAFIVSTHPAAEKEGSASALANSSRLPDWLRAAKGKLLELVGEACCVICGES